MNCKQGAACTNKRPPVSDTQPLVLIRWMLIPMHPPVSNTRLLVLTRWTLVLIHDSGSAQETSAPLLKGKTGHLLKQAGTSLIQAYVSLKQAATCL